LVPKGFGFARFVGAAKLPKLDRLSWDRDMVLMIASAKFLALLEAEVRKMWVEGRRSSLESAYLLVLWS
jgi:hypothetical protein